MKQMKRLSVPMNKSVKKYDELLPDYEKNFRNVLDYSTIKKKKVSHSTRKIYTSMLTCYNSNHDEVLFPLFTDKDIIYYNRKIQNQRFKKNISNAEKSSELYSVEDLCCYLYDSIKINEINSNDIINFINIINQKMKNGIMIM